MIETKDFEETFRLIKSLCVDKVVTCVGLPFALSNVSIMKDANDNYILHGETNFTNDLYKKTGNTLRFQIRHASGNKYIVKEAFVVSIKHPFTAAGSPTNVVELDIKLAKLKPLNTREETRKYHRLLVPCLNTKSWMHDICTYSYGQLLEKDGKTRYHVERGVFQVAFPNVRYEVYPFQYNNCTFLVIDSLSKCTTLEIVNTCHPITLTLSWFLGVECEGHVFVVDARNKSFNKGCHLTLVNHYAKIPNNYPIFSTNMYSLMDYMERKRIKTKSGRILKNKQGEYLTNIQDWLHEDEISNIVHLLYENQELARAVYILNAASTAPLDYQASLMSVALETITTFYDRINPDKRTLVIPKEEWTPICAELLKTLKDQRESKGFSSEVYNIFEERIKGDINRQTNAQKLSKPFDLSGYQLSQMEQDKIKKRNNFLHGRLEDMAIEEKRANGQLPPLSIDQAYEHLITTSVVLHRLCSVLILKLAQFSGYIINYLLFYFPHSNRNEQILIKI